MGEKVQAGDLGCSRRLATARGRCVKPWEQSHAHDSSCDDGSQPTAILAGNQLAGHFVQTKARNGLEQVTANKIKKLFVQQRASVGDDAALPAAGTSGGIATALATSLPDGV